MYAYIFVVVVLATPRTAAHQALLTFTISWSFLKLLTIELVMPSNHPILCHPLLFPPIIFPSIRVFSSKSTLPIRWQKYWRFSCRISPSNEYSGLISFRTVWLDLLAVQGTLKSLLQHRGSQLKMVSRPLEASAIQPSDRSMVGLDSERSQGDHIRPLRVLCDCLEEE